MDFRLFSSSFVVSDVPSLSVKALVKHRQLATA